MTVWPRLIGALLVCLWGNAMAQAAELIILTSQGNGPGMQELGAAFARDSGHKVTVLNATGAELERRLSDGPADLMATGPETIEALTKKGRAVSDSASPYMLAGLGVSVRAGAAKPDISTAEAYKTALLNTKSIGYSRGCSGINAAWGIAQLGIMEQVKPKLQLTGRGTGPVTFFLARGDFELGIQQSNIMVGAPGTDYLGPVPAALNRPCPYSVAILTVSKQQDAARAMIRFMTSPEAAPILRKAHEEPVAR